jgi:hypothetical protein
MSKRYSLSEYKPSGRLAYLLENLEEEPIDPIIVAALVAQDKDSYTTYGPRDCFGIPIEGKYYLDPETKKWVSQRDIDNESRQEIAERSRAGTFFTDNRPLRTWRFHKKECEG